MHREKAMQIWRQSLEGCMYKLKNTAGVCVGGGCREPQKPEEFLEGALPC
jgi:hypothetical protein